MNPEKVKIYVSLPQDRDAMAMILARNGYTVRQGKEKKGNSRTYEKYIEFWQDNVRSPGTNQPD